ncbi:ATP-binding protein [Colwellia sp. MSW7]|uniref:histidine kinase n=1 Tax=Colwellia maritima TaxID=2912588 RepID=A0ABS9X0Y8_9GAMM|nr:MHYT domain-containing protein [Colwellia maritima]MCI2283879.1 ATP-binding protein [Colwellia maritima]
MIKDNLELFQYSNTNLLTVSEYDPLLVVLSIFIAIFSSYMAIQVASQAARASFARKQVYLFIGSLALGGGIWSMHFIGMLALELCTSVSYQFDLTVISILPAVCASWVALNLITRGNLKYFQLVIGGVLVGGGIGAMHYIGMAAMEMAPLLRYDLPMFVVSILVAIILAILSLWVRFGLDDIGKIQLSRTLKVTVSSCVMGIAISGMHYTGMAAARFVLPPGFEASKQTDDISLYLALGITIVTTFVISVVLAVNLIFRYKNISAKALQNERRLSAIMETAVDGIITINAKGIIVSVNKMVTILLGWKSEELLGNNVKMIVPMPFQHNHDQYIENYLQTGVAKIIGTGREVEAMTKSGEKIPMRLGIGHVEVNDQHMFVAFISDLRDRFKMESTLRENATRIRSLLTNIPGIAYRCLDTPGWPNLFISDEVEKITGYPTQDFLLPDPKRSLSDFVHPDDFSIIEATDLRHPDGYQIEFRFIDRYNTVKWMLGYGRATQIENSNNHYLDGFIMDISDRKKMESEMVSAKNKAEKAAETRAAFLANMSHEIRTPMNAIIGFSDILLDSELNIKQHKYLNTINQSAKSLLHILNDLLDSAKLEKGKFQLEFRDFSLVEEVDAVVSTLWLEAQNKGLVLNLNIHPKVRGYYNGAPDRIRQVLTNLLGNAIKFTEQGTINIKIETLPDQMIQFIIKDTGIGMTPSQLETIFDAFAQADESMSRRFGGTGLGTTISKQLVELMGGNIMATSIEGKGSEFRFTLPLKAIESMDKVTDQQSFQTLPNLHILVVDDIDQNIELLTLILKRHGHTVFEARDGEQALVQMENNSIDVVLMDIQMPVMDGLMAAELRRKFETDHHLKRIPIIALTASVLPQDRISAERAGMDGFANKPINIRELFNEIASVLKLQNIPVETNEIGDKSTLKIDVDMGMTLWGSKTNFYAEISRFIKNAESEVCSFKQYLIDNDWQTLEQLAHKYKGSVGNLALNRLMKMFELLEQTAKNREIKPSQINIANIETEVQIIKDCVIKMSDGTDEIIQVDPNVSDESINSLIELLQQLQYSVQNNEFDDALLDKLQALNPVRPKEINDIINACNDFEFLDAANLINILISESG